MFNILLISKHKVGVWHHILGYLFEPDMTVMSELAIYGVQKLIAMFCFITCKVLAAEWHDRHQWTELNTADNVVHMKFPTGRWKLVNIENV